MRSALLALALSAAGCSIVLQDRPSATASVQTCSSSKLWPVIDTVIVAAGVAAVAYGMSRNDGTGTLIAGPSAVGSVVVLASARNGYRWSKGCETRPSSSVARR